MVLLDNFGPKQFTYLGWYIQRWADLYSYPMETKGGGQTIRPKHVVVTTNYTIEQCFPDDDECASVARRFNVINLLHWRSRINTNIS